MKYGKICYRPEYAGGFDIVGLDGYESRILRVKSPWQDADSTSMELFVSNGREKPPRSFRGQFLKKKAERVAVMSTSHIGLLSAIGAAECVAAVSGLDYVSSPEILARKAEILESGPDTSPDYEGLLASDIDIVLIYGIASASPMEKKLESLGIPYIYIGEYFERTPLGRAEWMVAIAEIIGRTDAGTKAFDELALRYNSIKDRLSSVRVRPKVMLNAPYGGTWFMSPSNGVMANLIYDAGGEYVYKDNPGSRSRPIGIEQALLLVSESDLWLDAGPFASLAQLKSGLPSFCSAGCVDSGKVYNSDRRLNPRGGNDFWESAPAMPDVLLSDMAAMLHPEIPLPGISNDSLYFYRKLE